MDDTLKMIAKALSYRKTDRLVVSVNDKSLDALYYLLSHSIKGTYAMLFLPGRMIQISPYGMELSIAISKRNTDNYLTIHPKLNEKFLRQVFTGLENILYVICHIMFERQRYDYEWETEKTRERFAKIVSLLTVKNSNDYNKLFEDIFFVRDALRIHLSLWLK
jgi:hypothetical protein